MDSFHFQFSYFNTMHSHIVFLWVCLVLTRIIHANAHEFEIYLPLYSSVECTVSQCPVGNLVDKMQEFSILLNILLFHRKSMQN